MRSSELFCSLFDICRSNFSLRHGNFAALVEVVLLNGAKFDDVQKSMRNLELNDALTLDAICQISPAKLEQLIADSKFVTKKSLQLKTICQKIKFEFEDFANFALNVDREWFLGVRGVGVYLGDMILCFACEREILPFSRALARILSECGYEFEHYEEAREWLEMIDEGEIYKISGAGCLNEIFRIYSQMALFLHKNLRAQLISNLVCK